MEFPISIENGQGEKLIFEALKKDEHGEYLEVTNQVQPGSGPPMHVHFRQEESLTVTSGKMGYQIWGSDPQFAEVGETLKFKPGVAHRFWAEGEGVLKCKGYIRPPDNIVYFLSKVYQSTRENAGRPSAFDSAWLLHHYRSEFDILGLPAFVRRVIFPASLFFGKLQGKHKKFADAPEART